jgi:uncharacterized repeat protein (TIGR03803 family)
MKTTSLLRTATAAAVFAILSLVVTQRAQAQTETVLDTFCGGPDCFEGDNPMSGFITDGSGNMYGTTTGAGIGGGTVFWLSPKSPTALTVIYDFCSVGAPPNYCYDGNFPVGPLVFDSAGNLYGETFYGGAYDAGTVFELSPEPVGGNGCPSGTNPGINGWCETVLWNFCSQSNCADGSGPAGGLVLDSKGRLYGSESAGAECIGCTGNFDPQPGVFMLYPNGSGGWSEAVIYVLPFPLIGQGDISGGLAIDGAGQLYGVDSNQNLFRLVFECFQFCRWTSTYLHTFGTGLDGAYPNSPVVLDGAGNIYGTTQSGGNFDGGTVWKLMPVTVGNKKGTYKETILHSFNSTKNGFFPYAGVTLDSSGNVYGTTADGGKYGGDFGGGTIFKMTASGTTYTYKLLWNFNGIDGYVPFYSPIVGSSGNLYGTTTYGGPGYDYSNRTSGYGLVYELEP